MVPKNVRASDFFSAGFPLQRLGASVVMGVHGRQGSGGWVSRLLNFLSLIAKKKSLLNMVLDVMFTIWVSRLLLS